MQKRTGVIGVACVVALAGVLPAAANARTKTVYADAPPSAQKALSKYGASANEFFLNRVTINVGDTVSFQREGFHTIDLPGSSGHDVPLIIPGNTATGVDDFAGNPFWFSGHVPSLGINPLLLSPSGPATYNGTTRIDSGLPLGSGPPKPLDVKFTKAGTYKFFCDVHPGMIGYVVVKPKSAKVPTARQDAQALKVQVQQAEKAAKQLSRTKPAKNTVSIGASAPNGVEDFKMFPASLKVKAGTVVTFFVSSHSRETHTASFGPTGYLTGIANSIAGPSPDQQLFYPSDNPALGPPVVSPTAHGNGFANTGAMDRDPSTVTIPSSGKLKFTTAGTYQFICLIHPFMHGTIVVTSP